MPISPVLGSHGTRVAQQPDGALEAGELCALCTRGARCVLRARCALCALGGGAAGRASSDARGARVEHGAQLRRVGRREPEHLEAEGVRVVAAEQQRGLG